MKDIKRIFYWAMPVVLLLAFPAHAHPLHGDAAGFAGGLMHPLSGIDHLLAMVAVGIWAAQLGGSAVWKVPMAFVITMLLGAAVGLSGTGPVQIESAVEPVIAASVLVLGLVISLQLRLLPGVASLLVAAFALFHGHAHMAELPAAVSTLGYVIGFALMTALLHGTGIATAYLLQRHASAALLRAGGVGVAGIGVWLLVGA